MRSWRQLGAELFTHGVNLAFDGIARDSPFGPALGNHGPKSRLLRCRQANYLPQIAAVQGEVHGTNPEFASQYGLELGSGE